MSTVTITNVGGDPLGISDYTVKINGELIAVFQHNRVNGLADCLREAANQVDLKNWQESLAKMMALEGKIELDVK